METAIDIIFWVSAAMMCVAALLVLGRLTVGPTSLDRVVALDLLTAVAIALSAILITWQGRTDLAVLLVVFALTGFFSSVVVARFAGREKPGNKELPPSRGKSNPTVQTDSHKITAHHTKDQEGTQP